MSYFYLKYWTLDIHIGLYSECLLFISILDIELSHWLVQQMYTFYLDIGHSHRFLHTAMSNLQMKRTFTVPIPIRKNVQYRSSKVYSLYKPSLWIPNIQYQTNFTVMLISEDYFSIQYRVNFYINANESCNKIHFFRVNKLKHTETAWI